MWSQKVCTKNLCIAVAFVTLAAGTALAQRGGREGAPAGPTIGPREFSGYWELPTDGRSVQASNLLPTVTKKMLDDAAAKDVKAKRWCNIVGVPAMMDLPRPYDLRVDDNFMVMIPEYGSAQNRWIYLNRNKHINEDEYEPSSNGDSIAHWESNTLVVDTVGFDPDHGLIGIPGGGYRTGTSHLVEYFTLRKSGQQLSVVSVWTDPKMFRTPHVYEYRLNRLSRDYEPRPAMTCDPYDEDRATFLSKPPVIPVATK